MGWSASDAAIRDYVEERQGVALRTYEVNPDLLEEHVRQEDSFRIGGYGERQISELLQNAVDALTQAGVEGRVEFRMANGALYCANEGEPFRRDGVRAVSSAFLSAKRGDEIGRFGLGFKSVLGITNRPQIFSSTVSLEFNAPDTARLFNGARSESGRLPLLRVPSMIDVEEAKQTDPNLRELMTWASTVIKLPLIGGGPRIRQELEDFQTQSLLFMKSVSAVTIALQNSTGALTLREHRREGDLSAGEVILHSPAAASTRWLFAEREHRPSEAVRNSLGATASRDSVTVSYAVPVDGDAALGQLWAWFPLQDRTTARGIFNAPWQVNDDRTTLLTTSAFNGELLDVCAELFLEVVVRASTPEDPGAHLDLFPARGKEGRSAADRMLSSKIPQLARTRPIIPDRNGDLRTAQDFSGVPELAEPNVPAAQMKAWQEIVPRASIPHWKCFTNNNRVARLRALLRTSDTVRSPAETSASAWLAELAHLRTAESVRTGLLVYIALRNAGFSSDLLGLTPIIPIEGNKWARADAKASVLLPIVGQPVPEGLVLVDEEFIGDENLRRLFHQAGFSDVSADQTVAALADGVRSDWSGDEWSRLWLALVNASSPAAAAALRGIRERGLDVKVATRAGMWRPACEMFVNEHFAPALEHRHVNAAAHSGRTDLLRSAGCLDGASQDFKMWNEPIYGEYVESVTSGIRQSLRATGHSARDIVIPNMIGAGPLQVFRELGDDQSGLVGWTRSVIQSAANRTIRVAIPLTNSQKADLEILTPEWWAVKAFGLVQTSMGPQQVSRVAGSALGRFGALIPVVERDISLYLVAPTTLAELPDEALTAFLERETYPSAQTRTLTELLLECAGRPTIRIPDRIPATSNGKVVTERRAQVVVAMSEADMAVLDEHGIAFLDGTIESTTPLTDRWELRTSEEALSRTIEISEETGEAPLLDRFPSLASRSRVPLGKIRLHTSPAILSRTMSPTGLIEARLLSACRDDVVIVDDSLDDRRVLREVSIQLDLRMTSQDIIDVLRSDDTMRRSELVQRARTAMSDAARLLILAGPKALEQALPKGLLAAVEDKVGVQTTDQLSELYSRVRGFDSLWILREELRRLGLAVPAQWAGSDAAQAFVISLGFATAYAGMKTVNDPPVARVQGRIELNPLHPFQEELAEKVRELALVPQENGDPQRGLLFLPTGAGKTRVTVEAIARMLVADELSGPILWIAQSRELCEQAIQTWTDVWRAIGDTRAIDVCRFWGNYELDESTEELQIIVAVDDKLSSRINAADSKYYDWLSNASLVIIDEAHTALSPTYTGILKWLGLTASRTSRPLLGLTATPYRGRNAEVNKRFVERFGSNKLDSLDPDDPIGQLRRERVLAEVDHRVLDGMELVPIGTELADFNRMKDLSKSMLDRIGQDIDRTRTLLDDIDKQDPSWPILVFAASRASAHTIAALLTLRGKEAAAVDGSMRGQERRRLIDQFRNGELQILVNCDLLTQGFDAPKVRALYVARPTFSPNRYHQMIGRGLRGELNGGTDRCLIVNIADTFHEFGEDLAFTEFDYLWKKQ
jgi:superfamily II DNA or RNA helicase